MSSRDHSSGGQITVKEAAKERFYGLVQDVYMFKLQNGELTRESYNDVYTAVDDIMKPINENMTDDLIQKLQADWTETMKDTHKQVVEDFKSGDVSWTDISMTYVRDLGRRIMRNVLTSADATFTAIRDKIFPGIANSADSLANKAKDAAKKAAGDISGIANKIFNSIGGGRNL